MCLPPRLAILSRSPLRFSLELFTSTLQFTGMIVFVGAELYERQIHVPALDPVGDGTHMWANVKFFDAYHFVYYWFGFWFCNLVWGVVPYYRLQRAVSETAKAAAAAVRVARASTIEQHHHPKQT